MSNVKTFLQVYKDVQDGAKVMPRGQLVKEVTDYKFTLDMHGDIITSFEARHLSLKYAKQEWLWYLRADKFDTSIEQHASLWQKIRQPDGSYFSNYGQYMFPDQFKFVCAELTEDKDSRRACIVLLKPDHLFKENKDVVCTYAINFRIRDNQLDMTVMMRSNDVIFGMTNDVFCFSMLYRMVFTMMEGVYQNLRIGNYTHFVNSLHVYERHFPMISNIVSQGCEGYDRIAVPWPNRFDVQALVGKTELLDSDYMRWLNG